MKKIVFLILVISLIIPISIFAGPPTEIEVQETAAVVLGSFGIIFMSAMFGESPEGVKLDMDANSGGVKMFYEDFDVKTYFSDFSEMEITDGEEMPEISFKTMSGTFIVDGDGNMESDMSFKGGNINTMKFKIYEDDMVYFTANGKDYRYIDGLIDME